MKKRKLIAIVDSGIGGLGLLKMCHKAFDCDFVYIMDNLFCPYGEKSAQVIKDRIVSICLYAQNKLYVDCVVLACNTATSIAISEVRSNLYIPVVGMEPPIKPAAMRSQNIVVMSTPITTKYNRLVGLYQAQNISYISCPNLAKIIEENFFNLDNIKKEIANYFSEEQKQNTDALVLGCSHFQFVEKQLKAIFEKDVAFYHSEQGVEKRIKSILNLKQTQQGYGKISIAQTKFDMYLLHVAKVYLLED